MKFEKLFHSEMTNQTQTGTKSLLTRPRPSLANVSVAMVEPEFSLNVGYLARVIANFGLGELYVVSIRRNPINKGEAYKFASHGYEVIDRMRVVKHLSELRHKFRLLIGTTAIRGKRKSNITRKTLELEEALARISKSISGARTCKSTQGEKSLCFVFGRDTTGLTNKELQMCDYTITIGTGTAYNTLNISHAAAIMFYELSRYRNATGTRQRGGSDIGPTRKEKEIVVSLFQELAELSDFQRYKREKLRESLTRLLARSDPSLRELYLLMGLAGKARTKIKILSQDNK